MLTWAIVTLIVGGLIWAYQAMKPPPSKICGLQNGPPFNSPRIRLSDGRHMAYKLRGVAKEYAKYKVILTHGFCASKDTYIPVSDEWLDEMGICLVTFDRPGYAESDPNSKRSPRRDAFDIQELADELGLGSKVYVIGLSMGTYPIWGCLKYIPQRFSGVALVVPVINYWWPSLPPELCSAVYRKLRFLEQWRLRIAHHTPTLAWMVQRWLPSPTVNTILSTNPRAFNKSDLEIMKSLSAFPSPDKHKILQQGEYESLHRDTVVSFSKWEFDPMEISNPFPNDEGRVHLWIGQEDGIVSVELQRHIVRKLPWMRCHEVPGGGHLIIHDRTVCEMILKSLVSEEEPSFP
ncbi:hypothetical protein Nepgr_014500 [Nepenthes gracilis]|uniref:AB hydrolase-1 domain-containing protein n=1 Tax=Nepenthes gracilis TaxID=150966 RepID=A0AAD3XQ69_NEPGR|nr:hypothetical protein Nepgr_014500 [Nepenthes gracilis]